MTDERLRMWVHKKTGNKYVTGIFGSTAINATNAQDGQRMVLYRAVGGTQWFVRELAEFMEKFEFTREIV